MRATAPLTLLLGRGEPLVGRLLTSDALAASFCELRLHKDPNCPTRGHDGSASLANIEYSDVACAIQARAAPARGIR